MDDSLLSILCDRGIWRVGSETWILFKKDNTGKISSGAELLWAILADFEWKCTAVSSPADRVQASGDTGSPHLLRKFDLEITITKHVHRDPKMEVQAGQINVTDDALRSRSFSVRLEEGNFPLPDTFAYDGPGVETPYTKRLVFDKSPYPPESQWNDYWRESYTEPEGFNCWDQKIFVSYHANWEEFRAAHRTIGM